MKRFILCLLIASSLGAVAQTTLHNGIVLPEQWLPRRAIPTERHEMEVPYLDNKPKVIPINTGRQLFVDNFLISQTNLTPIYHTPKFYENNPVLEPDKEWEKTTEGAVYAAPFSDGIWYDELDGKFKMWYLAGAGMLHKQDNQTFYTCYAESNDGKHWNKVNQDVVPGTNIVDTCDRDASTVWLDRAEPNPAKRWKFFNFKRPTHEAFMNVNETEGAWNWGNMQSINGVPLVVGDSLYFYSSGRRLNNIMWDSHTSTGLATLRRDGFVSMHADAKGGYLVTEPITFDGKYMFVNADIKGKKSQLTVEILDADGNAMPEYSGKNVVALKKVDSTKTLVEWRSGSDLSTLAGKTVRLRFNLVNGDLYSFWVSPWQTGESRGYTAGGGPGLSPDGVDHSLN